MPELCRFYGIVVQMFVDDHPPPHFHARYGSDVAVFAIETLDVLAGQLPHRAHALVIEWAIRHRSELRAAWTLASASQAPGSIDPLD
jgi:hypothetical protein